MQKSKLIKTKIAYNKHYSGGGGGVGQEAAIRAVVTEMGSEQVNDMQMRCNQKLFDWSSNFFFLNQLEMKCR